MIKRRQMFQHIYIYYVVVGKLGNVYSSYICFTSMTSQHRRNSILHCFEKHRRTPPHKLNNLVTHFQLCCISLSMKFLILMFHWTIVVFDVMFSWTLFFDRTSLTHDSFVGITDGCGHFQNGNVKSLLFSSRLFLNKLRRYFAGMLNTSRRNLSRILSVGVSVKRFEGGIPSLNEIKKPEDDYHPSKYTILG